MRYVLLMMVIVSGFCGHIFGSEKNDEVIVFKAGLTELQNNPLRYCEKEYIDFLNNHYGMQCAYNEPFIGVSYWQNAQNKFIERITFIPFKCFLDNNNQQDGIGSFKQCNAELLSCSEQDTVEKKFRIELVTDFGKTTPQALLNEFKKTPQCALGKCFDIKDNILPWIDTTAVEKELCDAGIICKLEGKGGFIERQDKGVWQRCWSFEYGQGINGYFGEEIKEEHQKRLNKDFWWIITPITIMGITLIAVPIIAAYVLYKKHHATA